MNVVEASGLGKRYGRSWALRECTLEIPAGCVAASADDGVSVLLSSHVLTELERVASYLVLMTRGQVRLAGQVDELLAAHGNASLEELALAHLRETMPEVTR